MYTIVHASSDVGLTSRRFWDQLLLHLCYPQTSTYLWLLVTKRQKNKWDIMYNCDCYGWFEKICPNFTKIIFFAPTFTFWQECAVLCWEISSCANSLPQGNQSCVSVISFRGVLVALVTVNRKTDAQRRLNRQRKLLRLLRHPQNDWILGLF